MSQRMVLCCVLLAALSCLSIGRASAQQSNQELSPQDWLPNSTAVYAQVAPSEKLLDHPLRSLVIDSPIVQELWGSDQLKQPRAAIASFELITATRLETVIRKLNAGGLHLAIDAQTQGAVILVKSESEKWLRQYLKRLMLLVRNEAKKNQQADPIKEATYLGIQGYEYQSNVFAVLGPWLLVTNKSELAEIVLKRYHETLSGTTENGATERGSKAASSIDTLANSPRFTEWQKLVSQSEKAAESELARVYLDLETLRNAGVANELLGGKSSDFGGELILGGVLAVLHQTPSAMGRLSLAESGITMDWRVPSKPNWIGESREFYAGPNASGAAPPLLELPGAIGSLSVYRDLSQMWLRSGDIFSQQVIEELAQADNTLTTLFSGKDFGEDILGAIEPQLQIIVAPQLQKPEQVLPTVQLPSFAMLGIMKSPATLQRELRRVYQNAIGFLNIVGAMEGNPQLDMQSEKDSQNQAEYYWAEYLPDSDKQYSNGLPIQFNFQPCLAFHQQSVIVSSHIDLAKQIIANSNNSGSNNSGSKNDSSINAVALPANNMLFSINANALTEILRVNRQQLVSNNVLEKGHSRDRAENEVNLMLDLLAMVQNFQGSLNFESESTALSLNLNLQSAKIEKP